MMRELPLFIIPFVLATLMLSGIEKQIIFEEQTFSKDSWSIGELT